MSESARKRRRLSPRDSEASDSADRTLHSDLRQLAGIIPKPVTPFRRAASAGPTPGSGRTPNVPIRTPGTAVRTPRGPSTRAVPTRRVAPTTPHAIQALRARANAARTPGRRRSGRVQRETPRDMLRALSRTLAKTSKPNEPSPQVQAQAPRNPALDLPDIDDGPDPVRPRLSIPLDDMYEDDSFDEAPPRMSILPDLPDDADTGTMHSLELGRRAFSEDPRAMYAGRISEHFGDLSALGLDGEEYEIDGTFINRRPAMDPDQILQEDIEEGMEDTGEIRALTGRRDGRPSDVDLGIFGDMDEPDEPTFRFTIPQRIRAPIQEEEPMDEDEEAEANAQDYEDVEAGAELDADLGPTTGDENEATARSGVTGWESEHDGEDDPELQAYREEESALDRSLHSLQAQSPEQPAAKANQAKRQRRTLNISRAGHEYPSFPAATVKRIATGLAKSQGGNAKISKDTLAALVQTTDWFFEQIGEDLAAYAQHAGRKVIEEADMVALMKRQRLITKNTTAFSLAQKMLPRELLQELRMQPVGKLKRQKRKRMEAIPEEEEEEA